MDAAKKIIKARMRLLLAQPFFGNIAMHLKVIETDAVPTAAVDGKHLYYNPKFIDSMEFPKVVGLMAHEVMHIVLMHHLRIQKREPRRFNVAGDFVINGMIKDEFELPDGGLIDAQYDGMITEKVYALLPVPPKGKKSNGSGGGSGEGKSGKGSGQGIYDPKHSIGEVLPQKNGDGTTLSDAQVEEAESDLKTVVRQAASTAKKAGKLPAGLDRLISEIIEPKADWQALLAQFVNAFAKNDYSYSRPNRRFMERGLIMPSLRSNELGLLVLCLDTSGSISNKDLSQFLGELTAILESFDTELRVLYADTKVYDGGTYNKYDFPLELKPKGGGGTSFAPVTKFIEDEGIRPTALIYFTDCYVSGWGEKPEYPVLIASTEEKAPEPPFGQVVEIY